MTEPQDTGAWHLDKRIPIALIFTIILQTGLAVWWVSNLSHRVDTAIQSNLQQDVRIAATEAAQNAQAVNAATTSAQLTGVRESLVEMKTAIGEMNRLLRDLARAP